MPRHSRPMPVEAFASAALAMDDGKNERKRIGSRTPTDAMVVFCRALRARPRLQIREAHIYRRSTAVLAKGTQSSSAQPQAMLPGTWPVRRVGVAHPRLSLS